MNEIIKDDVPQVEAGVRKVHVLGVQEVRIMKEEEEGEVEALNDIENADRHLLENALLGTITLHHQQKKICLLKKEISALFFACS